MTRTALFAAFLLGLGATSNGPVAFPLGHRSDEFQRHRHRPQRQHRHRDTRSTLALQDTITLLKASNGTVYAIGLVDNTGSYRAQLQMTLRQLVETTGGQYHLSYLSTNTVKDGAWRKVEIRVKRPDLRVRSRKGYFGSYQPAS